MAAHVGIISSCLVSLCMLYSSAAGAVCLDPVTQSAGYRLPLADEVRSADAIVIGRVRHLRALQEDPDDSVGPTAHEVSVEVLTQLKGSSPRLLSFRNENTSSRYPLAIGEKHLLFLSGTRDLRWVNSCGNSAKLPDASRLPAPLERELHELQRLIRASAPATDVNPSSTEPA